MATSRRGTSAGRASGAAASGAFAGSTTGVGGETTIRFNEDGLRELLQSENGPVAKDLARRANKVTNQAKRLCPVDTGRLRSSITMVLESDSDGLYAVVGTNVDYAEFVEFGTSTQRAQPFLRPALGSAT